MPRRWATRACGPPGLPGCSPASSGKQHHACLSGAGAATAAPPAIRLGLDTGGTYTDAVALDGERRVLASAKARTTHWDLAVGISEAIHALLSALPADAQRGRIVLVAVSKQYIAFSCRRVTWFGSYVLDPRTRCRASSS